MAENMLHADDKVRRYELFPPPRKGAEYNGGSSLFLDDDLSDDLDSRQFQTQVILSYHKLVDGVRRIEDYEASSLNTGDGDAKVAVPQCSDAVGSPHHVPTHRELNERYRRLVKIGEGSFGEVFIVFDTQQKTYFTMKKMRRLLHRGTHRSLFGLHNTTFRELQLLTTLRHPNIVEVLDYHILTDGSLMVLMPVVTHDFAMLARHWSLSSSVASGSSRMPLSVIKCLFRQLLEGVAYMHRHKVVHRDLKPSNIMLDARGVLKIIDFGWARYMVSNRGARMTGPPCIVPYRAPEVLIGGHNAAHYSFAVDIWCCGCILFEMLSAGVSFVGARNEAAALASIVDWLGSPPATSAVYFGKETRVLEVPRTVPNTFKPRCAAMHIATAESNFLLRMLNMEPSSRATARDLMSDEWFTAAPAACTPPEVPLPTVNTYRYLEHQRKRKRN